MGPKGSRHIEDVLRRLKASPLAGELRRLHAELPCPPSEALERFRHGELTGDESREISYHLLGCADCTTEILARERVEGEEEASARGSTTVLVLRRPTLVILAAAATIVVSTSLFWRFLGPETGDPLLGASLLGDRGAVRGEGAALVTGERFRISLRLARPASILVLHENPRGSMADVHPPPGDVPLIEGPSRPVLPGADDAWDSSELERGTHAFWILLAPRPIDQATRSALRDRLADALRGSVPDPRGRPMLVEEARERMRPTIVQVVELPVQVE